MIGHGVTYVPQGRNIIPQLSVWHNLELGGVTARDQARVRARMEEVMDQFPMLREHRNRKAIELSGGQQKQLEIARALILDPKLILIDEPSIGLSPNLVQEVFATLRRLRDRGVTVLMVEQNAKAALAMSDFGLVLELGPNAHARPGRETADRSQGRAPVPRRPYRGTSRLICAGVQCMHGGSTTTSMSSKSVMSANSGGRGRD